MEILLTPRDHVHTEWPSRSGDSSDKQEVCSRTAKPAGQQMVRDILETYHHGPSMVVRWRTPCNVFRRRTASGREATSEVRLG